MSWYSDRPDSTTNHQTGWYENTRGRLVECGQANKDNRWIFDKFENTVGWKRNGFEVIGVNTYRAIATKTPRLQSRSAMKVMQNWNPSSVSESPVIRKLLVHRNRITRFRCHTGIKNMQCKWRKAAMVSFPAQNVHIKSVVILIFANKERCFWF